MINGIFEQLIHLLEKETELLGSLLQVLEKEGRAIAGSNTEALNEAVDGKEKLLLSIQALEDQREGVIVDVAERLDRKPNELTLSVLVQTIGEPYSSSLAALRSKLSKLTGEIKKMNGKNRSLLTYSLEFVRKMLSIFGKLVPSEKVYIQTGKVRESEKTGILLCGDV